MAGIVNHGECAVATSGSGLGDAAVKQEARPWVPPQLSLGEEGCY